VWHTVRRVVKPFQIRDVARVLCFRSNRRDFRTSDAFGFEKSDRATDSEGEKLLSETFRRVYGIVLRRSTFFKITNMGLDLKRQDKLGVRVGTCFFPAYYGWIEEILLDSGNKDIKGDSHATQRRNT
jgi:hypothetical protein